MSGHLTEILAPPRDLVEEDSFKESKTKLNIDVKILDEIMFGFDYLICSNPELYPVVIGTNIRKLYTKGPHCLNIWYTFDEEKVYLLNIETNNDH